MLITSRKDHYRGLVTILIEGQIFKCDCGCEFFRETLDKRNLVRCNSCKVWHRVTPRPTFIEVTAPDFNRVKQCFLDGGVSNRSIYYDRRTG